MVAKQPEERVLIIAPVGQDAGTMAAMMETQGLTTAICEDPGECLLEIKRGAGALLITEEVLEMSRASELLESFKAQPPWSDLPVIILTRGGETRLVRLLDLASEAAGSLTLLERPMSPATLLRSVQVALRSRRRQYQVRDLIAEQGRREQMLKEIGERLDLALEGGGMGLWEWDVRSQSSVWNAREYELLGLPVGDGRPPTDLFFRQIHPEDAPGVETSLKEAFDKGRDWAHEFRVVRPDGQVKWLAGAGRIVVGKDGQVERMVGVNYDITGRKEAEGILARSRQELEQLVEERTAKLQELVGELEHFSYTITHDMRAPLRAMRGFAEVASELSSEEAADQQRLFLNRIITSAERMDTLITDALNYSRTVRQELPLAPVDLGKLLRGMLDSYPEFQSSEADITVERLPLVMGNEAGLTQCFSNLLGNAVKFVERGKRARVRVWSEPLRDDWVRIGVQDNGNGISPAMLPRIFDMFARGASPQAGTGIGLALVRKVVERMGGTVGVESEAGQGSRFFVDLRAGERKPGARVGVAGLAEERNRY